MKMYWLPREEMTGNRPVWSEYDLEVLGLMLLIEARLLLEMVVARFPGFGDLQGSPVLQKLGVGGVGVVVVEDEYILVSAGREYRESAYLVQA